MTRVCSGSSLDGKWNIPLLSRVIFTLEDQVENSNRMIIYIFCFSSLLLLFFLIPFHHRKNNENFIIMFPSPLP